MQQKEGHQIGGLKEKCQQSRKHLPPLRSDVSCKKHSKRAHFRLKSRVSSSAAIYGRFWNAKFYPIATARQYSCCNLCSASVITCMGLAIISSPSLARHRRNLRALCLEVLGLMRPSISQALAFRAFQDERRAHVPMPTPERLE